MAFYDIGFYLNIKCIGFPKSSLFHCYVLSIRSIFLKMVTKYIANYSISSNYI